jgi:hypothetical protein
MEPCSPVSAASVDTGRGVAGDISWVRRVEYPLSEKKGNRQPLSATWQVVSRDGSMADELHCRVQPSLKGVQLQRVFASSRIAIGIVLDPGQCAHADGDISPEAAQASVNSRTLRVSAFNGCDSLKRR